MADPKHPRKFEEGFKRQIVQLYDNGKTDGQLVVALSRGLQEAGEGRGVEASVAFSRMREELLGA